MLLIISACGGGKGGNSTPPNVGGGYTLQVTGGTLNDGSGVNGLVILATLRDKDGWGPTSPWTIKITGPDIPSSSPITLEYNDSTQGSFMTWEWTGFEPSSGTYRATATNGTTTIYKDFTINSNNTLTRPMPSMSSPSGSYTLSWSSVPGAASYSYEIYPPTGGASVFEYTTGTSVDLGTLTTNGDYLIRVRAYSTDRKSLSESTSASSGLATQENVSEYSFTFPVGGDQTSDNYSLSAAIGVMDWGLRGPGDTPIYGLSIWASIQKNGTPQPTAPEGNWNIKVTTPSGTVLNYIYPAGARHYAYWYYSIEPEAGTYTVEATYGSAVRTASITTSAISSALAPLLYSDISATLNSTTQDITITWNKVTNAKSYYINLWAEVWSSVTKRYEYKEVWRGWVKDSGGNTTSTVIAKATNGIPAGLSCDVYVTAHELDMTSDAPPSPVSRADMSENYYGYTLPFQTP